MSKIELKKQLILIEFGSYSTKIYRLAENTEPRVIVNPHNLITANGKFRTIPLKKTVIYKTKKTLEELIIEKNDTSVIAYATGIYRNSSNARTAIQIIAGMLDLDSFTVLSTKEEVSLSYNTSNIHSVDTQDIFIDMGGGSTEIAFFDGQELCQYQSIQLGALLLASLFVNEDKSIPEAINNIQAIMAEEINKKIQFFRELKTTFTQRNCKVIVTGMVAKKIKFRYLNDDTITMHSLKEHLMSLQSKITTHDYVSQLADTIHIKTVKLNLDMYLGTLFLIQILSQFGTSRIEIKRDGLSEGLIKRHLL